MGTVARPYHIEVPPPPDPGIKAPSEKKQFSPSHANHVVTGRINSSSEQSPSST